MLGVKSSSLILCTSMHIIPDVLTAKTGHHLGSHTGLYIPEPRGRHIYMKQVPRHIYME